MLNKTQDEITAKWKSKNTEHPLVSIKCLAFNQEKYIAQTLDGFLMQETDFPFEVIVHDDASKDSTADIIREYEKKYPLIVKPVYQTENQWSKHDGSLTRAANAPLKGKYIAECEGDDYWIDPLKLQRQVGFLESHPDYIYSHTAFKYYDQANDKFLDDNSIDENSRIQKEEPDNVGLYILDQNRYRIQTVTTVYNREYLSKISDDFANSGYFLMGDTQQFFLATLLGKFHYDSSVTSVYRLTPNSACHRGERNKAHYRFNLSCAEMRVYLSKYIHDEPTIQKFKREFGKALVRYAVFDPGFRSKIDESVIPGKFKVLLFLARHCHLVRFLIAKKGKYQR